MPGYPEGRVYVDAKVRTLVEKYHFPTESHVVELTNHHWESISADSIKVIWEKAHEQLKKIDYRGETAGNLMQGNYFVFIRSLNSSGMTTWEYAPVI